MNTHAQGASSADTPISSTIRVEKTELPVIAYHGQRVITTELLAQVYGADINNIKVNFSRNKTRFEEGKHYFKVTGDELKNLRVTLSNCQIGVKARNLILWTERGAARHAKMLDTDQAWEVFEKLEDGYFEKTPTLNPPPLAGEGMGEGRKALSPPPSRTEDQAHGEFLELHIDVLERAAQKTLAGCRELRAWRSDIPADRPLPQARPGSHRVLLVLKDGRVIESIPVPDDMVLLKPSELNELWKELTADFANAARRLGDFGKRFQVKAFTS